MIRRLLLGVLVAAAGTGAYLTLRSPADDAAPAAAIVAPPRTLLAIRWHHQNGELIRLDGRTLARSGKRTLPVGRYTWARSFSPDGSELVLARERPAGLRFVDTKTLRLRYDLPLPASGFVLASDWIGERRLLVLVSLDDTSSGLFLVDPVARKIVSDHSIDGRVEQMERSRRGLVLLLAPVAGVGPAQLVAAGADGRVRTARLGLIEAGLRHTGTTLMRGRSPGLAVDPAGVRAFVAGAGCPVAEVDLATMRVRYHRPQTRRSLASRLAAWVLPAAQAKGIVGPQRQLSWLGGGLLALTGFDDLTTVDRNGTWHPRFDPAGLTILDARDWTARNLDDRVTVAWPMGGGAILTLRTEHDDAPAELVGYGDDGTRLYTAGLEPDGVVYAAAPYAYVETTANALVLLDGRTGAILARRGGAGLSLLLDDANGTKG